MKLQLRLLAAAAALTILPAVAAADCYADYKAKKDDPLRLHYGVIALPERACRDRARAEREIAKRIAVDDWTLLKLMSVFDESGLREREESAGSNFLRY